MPNLMCRKCGAGPFDTIGAVRAHHSAAHGLRSGFAARGASGSAPRVRTPGATRRRIEDAAASADPEGSASEGSTDTDDGTTPLPSGDRGSDAPSAPDHGPSRPSITNPTIRIAPEQRQAAVADAVRDGLPLPMFADLIRSMSRTLSEIDGAGEAGTLSQIQAMQIATLLYDGTVDFVVRRFGGDVTRFKVFAAVLLVVLTKGTVHARAIRGKIAQRAAERQAAMIAQAAEPPPADTPPTYAVPILGNGHDPELTDTYAQAMKRQADMRARGME